MGRKTRCFTVGVLVLVLGLLHLHLLSEVAARPLKEMERSDSMVKAMKHYGPSPGGKGHRPRSTEDSRLLTQVHGSGPTPAGPLKAWKLDTSVEEMERRNSIIAEMLHSGPSPGGKGRRPIATKDPRILTQLDEPRWRTLATTCVKMPLTNMQE